MIVSKDDLVSLLNELSETSDSIDVIYPPIGTLFSIELGDKCVICPISKKYYDDARKNRLGLRGRSSPLDLEIPTHNEMVTCLYASSVLRSESEPELEKLLRDGFERDLLKGNKPLFIGYDNNSLRHRTNLVVENILSQVSRNSSSKVGFCLSEVVKNELRYRWDNKYRRQDIQALGLEHAQRFLNQHPKDARLARIGAVEYKHIMIQPNCEEATGRPRDYGDSKIISSYEFFRDKRNVDILLISGDSDFTSMAHDEKMPALHMEQPKIYANRITADWTSVIELLYCTAVIFGYICMEDVDIYGIWTGKKEDDWDGYNLSIDVKDKQIEKTLLKDVRIIEKGNRC